MLGNLIGGFIVILIGVTLLTTIAQQISLATSCPTYSDLNMSNTHTRIQQADTGKTDSFGGGGTGHFGGYDGKLEHKDFLGKVGEYSVIKDTDVAMFGRKDCSNVTSNLTSASNTLVELTTLFFALAIVTTAIFMTVSALRNSGLIGDGLGGDI